MNMKKMMALAAGSLAIAAQALTLSVKDVKIAQRYPWDGLVDIDYTVVCDEPTTNIWVYPVGYDADFNTSVAPRTLEGDGVNGQPVAVGAEGEKTFRMTWNMAADMPANYNRAKFSMKMYAYAGAAPYMVIDLSPGAEAEKYDVTYLNEIPGGEWDDEYKTSKLVLKLVCPGTFMMGTPVDEPGHSWVNANYEIQHKVTLTQPFYMGVFELTQKQYQLVTGTNATYSTWYGGVNRPVMGVSYNDIRGYDLGTKWPNGKQVDATSFFGILRTRTGITFDLPTEAQWEYTCRAGTGGALNSGKSLTNANLSEVARWYNNLSDGKGGYTDYHTVVGKYLPNAWGFYDMHGNVAEWCRDWWRASLSETETDPKGPESGSYRVVRGGGSRTFWRNNNSSGSSSSVSYTYAARSGARNYYITNLTGSTPGTKTEQVGFRVAAYPAE
ncbi:MAG: SUMF1/EgtB/PvdO family nonheme iron enzyme [Kiritimatiellae bacterium]|nr:SUMF1/EgtB/PvdO family nonheme iron enzyme [Kiritimatiellia bacterium]